MSLSHSLSVDDGWSVSRNSSHYLVRSLVKQFSPTCIPAAFRDALHGRKRSVDVSLTPNVGITQVEDKVKFPRGLKFVVDYVHSKGLKFGIYTARGSKTCLGRPGSDSYESEDANLWANWGVDYLKEDSCGGAFNGVRGRFPRSPPAARCAPL